MPPSLLRLLACLALLPASVVSGEGPRFDFGPGKPQSGFVPVAPGSAFNPEKGYGFLAASGAGAISVFAVDVGEGNHRVTMRFGHPDKATSTTVKAENRRLLVEKVETRPGQFETRGFTVNVRHPRIAGGGEVSLNNREKGPPVSPSWDNLLTFEFNGSQPGVASLEIGPAEDAVTVFLAGDSTVTDQGGEPFAGWGQMLPRFFGTGASVSNHAESGLALFSFESQKRLTKLLSMMRKGDYLLIQFGHNDQKDKRSGAGPFTTYKANLKKFVAEARAKGGVPVLVTPMERRRWNGGKPEPTLADYAEAVRQVGTEEKVPVIDLNSMSLKFYAALGPDRSTKAFAYAPANTIGNNPELKDNTHHNNYGGYELARCVVEGIRSEVPALAKLLAPDAGSFDPSKPDAPEKFSLPMSPVKKATETPAGN